MVVQKIDETARLKRERIKLAINLAMESRWEEAVTANRLIVVADPNDVDAWNRLGKALTELGQYTEAQKAFSKSLAISPSNPIAKKNLERIRLLGNDSPTRTQHRKVPPQFFIEETGKTGLTSLIDKASEEVVARISAGEPVTLEAVDHKLVVKNADGVFLGAVEPKLGLRLLAMMRAGNKYAAAVTSADVTDVRVFIRETYQHPSQHGRPSFPTKGTEDFRPYTWEGVSRFGQDDDEAAPVTEDEWDIELDEERAFRPRVRRPVAVGAEDEEEF